MCYSAKIIADFRVYQRFGGTLDLAAYQEMAGWTKKHGNWIQGVPKAMRNAFLASTDPAEQSAKEAALDAYRAAALGQEQVIAEQTERLLRANAVLAGAKPTKKAEEDRRIATSKITAAKAKLAEVNDLAAGDGYARIWPGGFAPVLIRDPATGERVVVPMRYRCRLPSWTEADERAKPGTYNARRDSLATTWRKLWGHTHGVMVASRFYEVVMLHNLQHRPLAPGEREISVDVEFRAEPAQDLFLACLWRYVEPTADEPGLYTVAAITRDPPPEISATGHNRCIVAIRPENLDAWLDPDPGRLGEMAAILDSPIDAYYEHELVEQEEASGSANG